MTRSSSVPIRLTDALLRRRPLPDPHAYAAKDDRGRVLIVAGSAQVPGAALLAGEAAFRAGAGKVTLAVPKPLALPIGLALPEAKVVSAGEVLRQRANAWNVILVGPGMSPPAARRVRDGFMRADGTAPLVLDAAAIEGLAARTNHDRSIVITPHAGEMAKLAGQTRASIEADPATTARAVSQRWRVVTVLKGQTTIIAAPDGGVFRHEANVPGLAVSGSGDVLAGLIAGLLARGTGTTDACLWAVVLHARAGLSAAERAGPIGYLPHELAPLIPALMKTLSRNRYR